MRGLARRGTISYQFTACALNFLESQMNSRLELRVSSEWLPSRTIRLICCSLWLQLVLASVILFLGICSQPACLVEKLAHTGQIQNRDREARMAISGTQKKKLFLIVKHQRAMVQKQSELIVWATIVLAATSTSINPVRITRPNDGPLPNDLWKTKSPLRHSGISANRLQRE